MLKLPVSSARHRPHYDDTHPACLRVRDGDDGLDVILHIAPVAAEHLADVDHHVQLLAAVGQRLARFGDFDGCDVSAMGKADCRAGFDCAAG